MFSKKALWIQLIFLTFSASSAFSYTHKVGVLYGYTHDFWETVKHIEKNHDRLSELNHYLDSRYGINQVGLIHTQYGALIPQEKFLSETFPLFSFHLRGDALAGGEITNPVFPRLKAYQAITGEGGIGIVRPLRLTKDFEWGSTLGFQIGTGKLKTLEKYASDFIEKMPAQEGNLNFVNFDVSFGFSNLLFDHFRSFHAFYGFPTYYHYQIHENEDLSWKKNVWKLRWNYTGKWYLSSDEYASTEGFHIGALSTFGNYPIPHFSLLPKSWEYVQNRNITNSFIKMSGLGAFSQIFFDTSSLYYLDFQIGVFAGLLGGSGNLKLDWFFLEVGSWGLDTGVRYLIEETRLNYAKIGISI